MYVITLKSILEGEKIEYTETDSEIETLLAYITIRDPF